MQAYDVIMAAVEKQQLLQQKQDISDAIQQGEEDVAALETAFAQMTGSNTDLAQRIR